MKGVERGNLQSSSLAFASSCFVNDLRTLTFSCSSFFFASEILPSIIFFVLSVSFATKAMPSDLIFFRILT